MPKQRIGIFSGVFDPVHKGHISLTLAAIKAADLDKIYILIEAKPRRKTDVTHLTHRTAMVKLAIQSHPKLELLDLPDKQFSVAKTLPRLKQRFPDDELFFIAGSDMLHHMPEWPLITPMLKQIGLIIGRRSSEQTADIQNLIDNLPIRPSQLIIIDSPLPDASSGRIRRQLARGQTSNNLSPYLASYIKKHWLYTAPSSSNSSS